MPQSKLFALFSRITKPNSRRVRSRNGSGQSDIHLRKRWIAPTIGMCLLGASSLGQIRADDWPQFNGPNRDGIIREPGLPTRLDAKGLARNWSTPIGAGYSAPVVSAGKVYVSDYIKTGGEVVNNPGARAQLSGSEGIVCLDLKSGTILWQKHYERDYSISYPSGPRATPTVDESHVYFVGAEGDLSCHNKVSGDLVWKRQLRDEYKTESPMWGYSSAPLAINDSLIVLAGGTGSTVVSLDKSTGKEKWRSLSASNIGYAPPTIIETDGTKQLIIWDADALSSLDINSGKVLWTTPLKPRFEMSIMAPVVSGNRLYASGIGGISGMFELKPKASGISTLWTGTPKNSVYCSNSTPIFDGDYVYGCDCEKGTLMCVQASDGKRLWESALPTSGEATAGRHATVFLAKMNSVYYLLSETGDFIIAKLSPEKYEEVSRYHVIDPTNECFGRPVVWAYPAFANGKLLVRNDKEINCYELKAAPKQ